MTLGGARNSSRGPAFRPFSVPSLLNQKEWAGATLVAGCVVSNACAVPGRIRPTANCLRLRRALGSPPRVGQQRARIAGRPGMGARFKPDPVSVSHSNPLIYL
jgi:hypothetical protein